MLKDELLNRNKKIAHDCVRISLLLRKNKPGFHFQDQLIRCLTYVEANYRAVNIVHSKDSFLLKLSAVNEGASERNFFG